MSAQASPDEAQHTEADGAGVWLTSEQAGRRLGLGVNTLAEWRCERRVNQPPFAKFGKAVRYRITALDAWADSQVVRADESSHP